VIHIVEEYLEDAKSEDDFLHKMDFYFGLLDTHKGVRACFTLLCILLYRTSKE